MYEKKKKKTSRLVNAFFFFDLHLRNETIGEKFNVFFFFPRHCIKDFYKNITLFWNKMELDKKYRRKISDSFVFHS